MNKRIIIAAFAVASLGLVTSCSKMKDQLQVGNPNAPTLQDNVKDLKGIVALAQGGTYFNGFRDNMGWLGDSYYNLPWNYHELMGDNTCGGEGSNNQTTTMGVPDWIETDGTPGSKLTNSSPQVAVIRAYNTRAATGNANNALYYEWVASYQLNGAMNIVLSQADVLSKNGKLNDTQLKTIQAWAHFWKGFAYSNVGTMYYGGLIIDEAFGKSSDYVSHDAMVTAGSNEYDKAATLLGSLSDGGDYAYVIGKLIPAHCQTGLGNPPTTGEWKAVINTLKARNILENRLSPFVNGNANATISKSSMTAISQSDWATIKSLTDAGIQKGQNVFTGRTTDVNNFFSANSGSVAAYLTGKASTAPEKVSERLIQNFDSADLRLTTNFNTDYSFTSGYSFTTRYSLQDGGGSFWPNGAYAYGTKTIGAYELFLAGSYEENALMGAEARIRTGDIAGGMALINAVKAYQGAGVTASASTLEDAMTALTRERRVALAFRGMSFFDLRRWGVTYDVSKGGGAYGQVVVFGKSGGGFDVYPNATISYNYMDYWDVPGDETELNPAATGSEWLTNPNF